jgi:hypothetical protein
MPVSADTPDGFLHVGQRPGRGLLQVHDVVDRLARVPPNRVAAGRREESVLVARSLGPGEIGHDPADQAERPEDGDRREDRHDGGEPSTAPRRSDRWGESGPRQVRAPRKLLVRTLGRRGKSGLHLDHGRSGIGEGRRSLEA